MIERDVPLEAIIGVHIARDAKGILSSIPRKIWHAGVDIVAKVTDGGYPKIISTWNSPLPEVVETGLKAAAPMLTEEPMRFRVKGFNVLAQMKNNEPHAVLVWKGGSRG